MASPNSGYPIQYHSLSAHAKLPLRFRRKSELQYLSLPSFCLFFSQLSFFLFVNTEALWRLDQPGQRPKLLWQHSCSIVQFICHQGHMVVLFQ